MTQQRKPARLSLRKVQAGDVFAMPLSDGRYGVCRVLRVQDQPRQVLVTASPWVGSTLPDLSEPELRTCLNLTHHSWSNSPCMNWISEPVPVR